MGYTNTIFFNIISQLAPRDLQPSRHQPITGSSSANIAIADFHSQLPSEPPLSTLTDLTIKLPESATLLMRTDRLAPTAFKDFIYDAEELFLKVPAFVC